MSNEDKKEGLQMSNENFHFRKQSSNWSNAHIEDKRDSPTPTSPPPHLPTLPFSLPIGMTLKASHANSQNKDLENSSIAEFQ